jgi:hypothetical protein
MIVKLFNLQEGHPYFTEEALQVKEIKNIVDSFPDTYDIYSAIIYHMTSPLSVYFDFGDAKEQEICKDFLKPEDQLPIIVYDCIRKVNSFKSAELRLLEGSLIACDKISNYFQDLDFSQLDDQGKLINNPNTVMGIITKLGSTVQSLQKVRDEVKKGMQAEEQYYGDRELNVFDQINENNE